MLDQLIGPLSSHINNLLSQPVTGTDDQLTHIDTKRAYLTLLNTVITSKLHGIFTSERTCFRFEGYHYLNNLSIGNKGQLEGLLQSMQNLVEDVSDPSSQRASLQFLGRCVTVWAQPQDSSPNGNTPAGTQGLPGFERFVYERLVPTAFSVLSSSQFNIKDGQMLVVGHIASHENYSSNW